MQRIGKPTKRWLRNRGLWLGAMQLGEGMQEILYYMSQLFTHKAQGIEWSPDMDLLLTGGIQQEAYAVALATDGLLSMIRALSDLTVAASPSVCVLTLTHRDFALCPPRRPRKRAEWRHPHGR
jgi:hypothetical protein